MSDSTASLKTADGSNVGPVIMAAVLSAVLTAGTLFVMSPYLAPQQSNVPFVVIDSGKLVTASMNDLRGKGLDESAARDAAVRFADQLKTATQRYVDAGFVVVHRTAVLGYAPQLEITQLVADELGLTLE